MIDLRPTLLAASLVAVACSSSLTRQEAQDAFIRSNPEASDVQASCVIDELASTYGLDGLEAELERDVASTPFQTNQFKAMFVCGLTEAVQSQLGDLFVTSGMTDQAAKCSAKSLTASLDNDSLAVLLSGDITDDFYKKYFEALESCGALPG